MNKVDIPKVLFVVACGLLVFSYGYAVGKYKVFPHALITAGQESVSLLIADIGNLSGARPDNFLQKSKHQGDGVTRLSAEQAAAGLTLVTGFFDGGNELRLIRLDGSPVRRWPVRYLDIFEDDSFVKPDNMRPRSNWHVDIHGAMALPDGSVVFNFDYRGTVKLDRCGKVLWRVRSMTHHSIDRSQDGSFWIPGRRYIEGGSSYLPIRVAHLEDTILKVSPEGEILREISVPELMLKNGQAAALLAYGINQITAPQDGLELLHVNDIEELDPGVADRFPRFAAGDLVLSLRDLNLLMVVDPNSETVKWRRIGPWVRQHDPDFQADGTISLFNNNSDNTADGHVLGGSNILKIDPEAEDPTILYGATAEQNIYTNTRGNHQILDNGNILITQFEAGRIVEVNQASEIVWEFINRYDAARVAEISQAIRYPADYFTDQNWTCG